MQREWLRKRKSISLHEKGEKNKKGKAMQISIPVRETRINIKPVSMSLVHEYYFEGPCRFGRTEEQLSTEYDQMAARAKHKKMMDELNNNLPSELVNIMEPVYIEKNEEFFADEKYLDLLRQDSDEVDLFWLNTTGLESLLDYYEKYDVKTPVAAMRSCCRNFQVTATFRARGIESYGFLTWDEAIETISVLRARKVLRETKILLGVRNIPNHSATVLEGFLDNAKVTETLGCRFRYVNVHEILDQFERIPADQNHTLPGRRELNITEEDDVEIKRIAEELKAGAQFVKMPEQYVERSVDAYYVVQKLLAKYQCNAFTMPCADVCATRRYNEEKLTMCLTHSLNNERGICSACEFDIPCLISMIMLASLSQSAPYMGNTAMATLAGQGGEIHHLIPEEEVRPLEEQIAAGHIGYTFHSVPNRKLHGFDSEASAYGLRNFAAVQQFGATIRYDFKQDIDQTITMCRIDPTCTKLMVARGTVVTGIGFDDVNCSEGVFFSVKNPEKFVNGCSWTGMHIPLVYGDVYDELIMLGNVLGLEVLETE